MNLNSFMESLQDMDTSLLLYLSMIYVVYGLYMIHYFSKSGRPVAHPDRDLGRKHKEAEAERVEILDRLNSGSKVGELKAEDEPPSVGCFGCFGCADVADVEKEPLRSPLLPHSSKEANVATISLSSGGLIRSPLQVCESMRTLSEATACGEFVDDNFVCSPDRTRMQTKVELHDGVLERLKDLVKKSTTPEATPKEFSPVLQVDSWAILKPSDQGVKLWRLPTDKLPVILHAEYAAGLLTITGLNLEDADIFASAENASYTVKLNVFRFEKGTKQKWKRGPSSHFSNTEEDVAILPFRLSWKDMKDVFIYATKKVHLGDDGQSVNAMSQAVRILDSFWKTVLALWIPTIGVWIFTIYNIRALLLLNPYSPTKVFSDIPAVNGFYFLIWTIILTRLPSNRFVDFVKYHAETVMGGLGQGLMVSYYGFKSLKGPHLEFSWKYLVPRVLPPPPPPMRGPPSSPPLRSRPRHDRPQPALINSDAEATSARSVEDPDWEWPAFDQFEDKYGKIDLKIRSQKAPDEVSPFRAIYRRRKEQLWPDVVQIGLTSAPLIEIVQKFLPQNGDLHCLENPTLNGRDLFTVLDDIKNRKAEPVTCGDTLLERSQDAGPDEGKGELHLKHLLRFMDREYGDVSIRLRRMTEEKRVAWDMLWTFLTPGKKVVYNCDHSEEMLAAVVSKNSYTLIRKEWFFLIELDVWDYDGKSYHKCQIRRTIQKFEDERAFSSLAVRPIEIAGVPEVLDEGFLANGKRFYELGVKDCHRFMHYSGPMFKLKENKGCLQIVKENADGRVMIDLASFAKMNPGYPMGRAKPPVASVRGSTDPFSGRRISFPENDEVLDMTKSSSGSIKDETLIFAPAIVYGFSFNLKEWGSFAISGFSEISFNTNAFDALVMEPDSKQLVYNLVREYIATPVGSSEQPDLQSIDPISNKGEGCVFLCYGPPGTGKTLTAESVAENMHRPLWSLNVSELGSTPGTLEKALFKVLDIAATWRAVVLLDEADCFLEKRTSSADLTRNAMAGVFLRFLEYYRGVLFLTTNRIGTFDNAFRSRISLFLHYPKLSVQHREQVWTTLLERAGVMGITADFVSQVAAEDLNGREIRNAIHTAQMWAKSNGQTLDQSHVRYVTRVLVSSLTILSDTIQTSESD